MKIAVICINQYLNVHSSIRTLFPDYDLYKCSEEPDKITAMCDRLKSYYNQILITSHNICYKSSKFHVIEHKPLDFIGGDYYGMPYATIPELFSKTCDDPIALAFNNKGYIKREITRQNLVKNDYLGPEGGIYIYSNKLDLEDYTCNIYLPSCLLHILPSLKLERVFVLSAEKSFRVAICIDGNFKAWNYIKDSFKNIAPSSSNMEYHLFIATNDEVSSEKLKREISTTGIDIKKYSINNKDTNAFKLMQKHINVHNTKYDIIVKTKFDTIVDKEINYNDLQPHINYTSKNKSLQMYINNKKQNETQIIPARTVDYSADKSFTFVTFMLDIGREDWNVSPKKINDYLNNLSKIANNPNFNFYIFADELYVERITNHIGSKVNYKLIPINFTELYTYKFYNKIKKIMNSEFYLSFLKYLGNNKIPEYCIPEYNTLLSSKVDLLYKASNENAFGSQYFIWIDLFDTSIPTYWNPLCIQHPEQIFICNNEPIENADKSYLSYFKDYSEVLSTNVFGGSKELINKLHKNYYKTLNDCLDKNITHNDRFLMSMCYRQNPHLFKIFSLRNDVLNNNTLNLNYFRLVNNYRVGIIIRDEDADKFSKEKLTNEINNLKDHNCIIDVYERNDTLKSDSLFTYSYVEVNMFPEILDKNILKTGKYDCIIVINKFEDKDTLSINYIQQSVSENTVILHENIIYGSYNIIYRAKF